MTTRLERRFAALRAEGRAGLVTFTTAGDPDLSTAQELLNGLPAAGADVIELGMPFSDPMADGPAIQQASQRALRAGMTLRGTLDMVHHFRTQDQDTPIILMGYFNPIYVYGVQDFIADAAAAGVDGFIIVDLPPEHDAEFCVPVRTAGLHFIRLTTPTTDSARIGRVLEQASGFVYYVSILGITGTGAASAVALEQAVDFLKSQTDLPLAVGFGIRTPEQAAQVAQRADAVVVGSAIVERLAPQGDNEAQPVRSVLNFVTTLAQAVRTARHTT